MSDDANATFNLNVTTTNGGTGTTITLDEGAQSAAATSTSFVVTKGRHHVQAEYGNSKQDWSGDVSQDTSIELRF